MTVRSALVLCACICIFAGCARKTPPASAPQAPAVSAPGPAPARVPGKSAEPARDSEDVRSGTEGSETQAHKPSTPVGPVRTGKDLKGDVDLKPLDLAVYPGAKHDGSTNIKTSNGRLVAAKLISHDSFDDVVTFYRRRYPESPQKISAGPTGKALLITVSPVPDLRTVRITMQAGSSHIAIDLMRQTQESATTAASTGGPPVE
ncbi:MAG: hypothetical protein HPY44_06020 [Armatimonadetes bacterium]|nr:hypothetical protein [Armatimonadota bacterium]